VELILHSGDCTNSNNNNDDDDDVLERRRRRSGNLEHLRKYTRLLDALTNTSDEPASTKRKWWKQRVGVSVESAPTKRKWWKRQNGSRWPPLSTRQNRLLQEHRQQETRNTSSTREYNSSEDHAADKDVTFIAFQSKDLYPLFYLLLIISGRRTNVCCLQFK